MVTERILLIEDDTRLAEMVRDHMGMTLLQQNQAFTKGRRLPLFETCSRQSAHNQPTFPFLPTQALAGIWARVIATPPRPSETRGGGGRSASTACPGSSQGKRRPAPANLVLPAP